MTTLAPAGSLAGDVPFDVPFHPASAPDFLAAPQLRQLQLQRLQATVRRAFDHVALVRGRMLERGLTPDDVGSLGDLSRLPFTVKTDLRDTYPFGLFASPMSEVVRLHVSSGTTGRPIVVAYDQQDVGTWTEVVLRCLASYGVRPGDVLQNAYGYGLFTGGLGLHYGAEALGATVIPMSGGNAERQVMLMKDFGVTALSCTPSYCIHLIERAGEMGVDMRDLPVRIGIFGAEPWTESMRQYIEANSKIRAYDIYGLSEIIGPGVGAECREQDGLHLFEDHFFPEIIDPESGEVLADGAEGELVLTTLTKRAMPMIRYRTRDITALVPEPCPCGRTIRRIRRIGRRSDDMLIVRGINVFPSQVETALLAVEGTLPHYQITLRREHGLDEMIVRVEIAPDLLTDAVRGLEQFQARVEKAIESVTGLRARVELAQPHSIARSEGKARRVIDERVL